jgi:uncharacterized membrane protein
VGGRWDTGRTEAFSDGVFAIAITLLVLEIGVPEEDFENLWRGIVRQWPSYLGYATSFLTIGGIWLTHHAIFRRLRFVDRNVMRLNLLLLMAVAFLPFPTKLMAEAVRDVDAERAAVVFYGLSLLVIAGIIGALWGAVLRDRELLRPELDEDDIRAMTLATTPNVGLYAVVTGLAALLPLVAAFGYLAVAILFVSRARADRPPAVSKARG